MFNTDEKTVLKDLVKRELDGMGKEECCVPVGFLKAKHEYVHFLEGLMEKLK